MPSNPVVELELDEIRSNLEEERRLGESSYLDCFKPSRNKIALRTLTGIFIQAYVFHFHLPTHNVTCLPRWQQLTGINFIFYYGTTFFQNSRIKSPFLINVATNVVNVAMTVPAIWGVERFGRRRLLLVGALGMCICEYIVAIVGVTISVDNIAGQKVLVAFVCIYIVSSSFSISHMVFIIPFRHSLLPHGVRLPGLSPVKYSR